jgi:protein gp37
MAKDSKIEWCESTQNFWYGCKKISPGCAHCYAYRDMPRYGLDPSKVVRSKTTFYNPLKWNKGRLIFACSWSDFFIKEADAWRAEAWHVIRVTPHHIYQILTKRPERIASHLPFDWPLPNVWLGVSVEDRSYGIPRIDILREIPAVVRFISAEPLLEDLGPINLQGIDWVIIAGESGPKSRRMDPEWARNIRDQCIAKKIPVFFKQWGEFNEHGNRVGKKNAGRILDGREWNDMPLKGNSLCNLQRAEGSKEVQTSPLAKG